MYVNDLIRSLPKIRMNGPIFQGCYVTATRKDGRTFTGKVVKIASYTKNDKVKNPGDTLVVVQGEGDSHRSFYMNDLSGWMVAMV